MHFPPDDSRYEGVSSLTLLREVVSILGAGGYCVSSVDVTIVAEAPKLSPLAEEMRATLAEALGTEPEAVSGEATTTEGLGPEGRGEAMSAHAVAVVRRRPDGE